MITLALKSKVLHNFQNLTFKEQNIGPDIYYYNIFFINVYIVLAREFHFAQKQRSIRYIFHLSLQHPEGKLQGISSTPGALVFQSFFWQPQPQR